jgi:transcriptional regulator with XRE-family HTH domain
MLRLKLLRISQGKSQWELGRAAKISQGQYSMIERGLIPPTAEERERLAQALSAPSSTLLRPAMRQMKKADCASTAQVMG